MKATREIAQISIWTAGVMALKLALAPFPNVKPTTALLFVLLFYFGFKRTGTIAVLSILISGFLFGMGPWMAEQAIAYGLVLWIFFKGMSYQKNMIFLSILAGVLGFLMTFLQDLMNVPFYGSSFLASGLPFDFASGLSTLLFYPLLRIIFKKIRPFIFF